MDNKKIDTGLIGIFILGVVGVICITLITIFAMIYKI